MKNIERILRILSFEEKEELVDFIYEYLQDVEYPPANSMNSTLYTNYEDFINKAIRKAEEYFFASWIKR